MFSGLFITKILLAGFEVIIEVTYFLGLSSHYDYKHAIKVVRVKKLDEGYFVRMCCLILRLFVLFLFYRLLSSAIPVGRSTGLPRKCTRKTLLCLPW